MTNINSTTSDLSNHNISPRTANLSEYSTLELAQALSERLAIPERDWHRLKSDRNARAGEHLAAALVFLLKNQPKEVIPRLNQAVGWLERLISAPPCPTHGTTKKNKS